MEDHTYRFGARHRTILQSRPATAIGTTLSRAMNGALVLAGGALFMLLLSTASPHERYSLAQVRPNTERTLVLLTREGEPFARRGGCVAEPVALGEVPQYFIDALLSMEDRNFYRHFGIDPWGVSRAAVRNWSAGAVVEGGSTITQQLAKISFLSARKTLDRKRREALLALWLETQLSKDEILEKYLSSVYFGDGCFGLRAAARHYFGKAVSDLTLGESAVLVALLRSPTTLAQDATARRARAQLVLQAMVDNRLLDRQEADAVALPEMTAGRRDAFGGYYADWAASTIKAPEGWAPLPVGTAFDPRLQGAAERAVESVLAKRGARMNASQAALVAMRPDGRVVAMVGGRDYRSSQFNRAVQALRQPGSSFKLFVYLAALRAGADPGMTVLDEPVEVAGWEPENFGRRYRGPITVSQAFASSTNSVAVRLSEAAGRETVIATARDLGITTPLAPSPSLALGTFETSLLEMTAAYAAVAAGAYPVKPWAAATPGEAGGAGRPPEGAGRWKLVHKDALQSLLAATVRHGSGRAARLPVEAFGKTGTSQENRDAWFIGFAGNLVVGVWVGNDDNSPMKGVTGGSLPAQIWQAMMREAITVDPDFRKSAPRIAAFEARNPPPSSARLSLQALAVPEQPRQQAAAEVRGWSFGNGRANSARSDFAQRPAPRQRGGRSPDFARQLRALGFPGTF